MEPFGDSWSTSENDPIHMILDEGLHHEFQPIWDLTGRTILGFEALARFPAPVTPDEVWRWAEEQQLQNPLDRLSIVTALQDGKDLPGKLFLNVSARYLELDGGSMEEMRRQIQGYRPLDSVVLEITETQVGNLAKAARGAIYWQEQGVSLALDDAGAKAATAERLALLRPQYVKVDQALFKEWVAGRSEPVDAWIESANTMGAMVIVEGVEDLAWLAKLSTRPIQAAQGYALGQAAPASYWNTGTLAHVNPFPAVPPPLTPQKCPADHQDTLRSSSSWPTVGESLWLWHLQLRAEKVLSPLRVVIVATNTLIWSVFAHPLQAMERVSWLVLITGWILAGLDLIGVYYGLWKKFSQAPYVATLIDLFLILGWTFTTGGRESPFLPMIFVGMLMAMMRLPLPPALMVVGIYTGAYAWLMGPAHVVLGMYILILGLALGFWKSVFDQDRLMSLRDNLTGAYGREYGIFELQQLLKRPQSSLVLLLMDLDYFKDINDRYGHLVGDALLQKFVTMVSNLKRSSDTLVRYGGDEFLLVCPDLPVVDALNLAHSIRLAALASDIVLERDTDHVRMSVSVGLTQIDSSSSITVDSLFHQVDLALYQAKLQRNTVVHLDVPPKNARREEARAEK